MANYESNLVKKKLRHRGVNTGFPYQIAGRIFLPSGTALTTSDDLLFVPVGELVAPRRVTLEVRGDTSTIAGSIGYFQILDDAGDPVRVDRNGPSPLVASTQYTSPATSAAAYRAAGQLDGYTETIITPTAALAGPANIGIRITTGGTIAADTEMFLGVEFETEVSSVTVEGDPNPDNDYLLD